MTKWALQAIKNLRSEKGYSQEYMSSLLNLNQTSYSRIESGYVPLTLLQLLEILSLLEIDTITFFNYVGELEKGELSK